MRKALLTILCAASTMIVSAQDMNSKRGTPILPEAKDWSIGVEANPFLNYFGNLFNHDDNSFDGFQFADPNHPFTIVGLYVKDENTAYRGKLRIGFGSTSRDIMVDVVNQTPGFDFPQVTNTAKSSYNAITIGAGLQKSRGKGRLHGIYGVELLLSFGSSAPDSTYEYGQALSDSNNTTRTTKIENGSNFGIGLRGFIGAEYFFAPKMSVSGEFGWGLAINSTGEGTTTTESWDTAPATHVVKTSSTKTGKSSNFYLDTDNMSGSVILHFYF